MKDKIRQYISSFWNATLDKEKKKELLQLLEENNDEIRSSFQENFDAGEPEEQERLTDEEYLIILQKIHLKMGVSEHKTPRINKWIPYLVAASIVVVTGLTTFFFYQQQIEVTSHLSKAEHNLLDSTYLVNASSTEKSFTLPDGSTILLSPGSNIKYNTSYGEHHRDLYLHGRAQFNVAHDKRKPFVVHTLDYSTTALGTEFVIDARHNHHLNIKLLTGKIVVKKENTSGTKMSDQYLLPGDELIINTQTALIQFHESSTHKIENNLPIIKSKTELPQPIRFEETPLEDVFLVLAKEKNRVLNTDDLDLDGLYFTGDFQRHESLISILTIVCQMNGLLFTEEENTIIIKKATTDSTQETQTKIIN